MHGHGHGGGVCNGRFERRRVGYLFLINRTVSKFTRKEYTEKRHRQHT